MKMIKRKDNEEKRVSGIKAEEEGELDKSLRDIVELFDDSKKTVKEGNTAEKQKLEQEASLKPLVKQKLGKGKRAQAKNQKSGDHQII